MSDDKPFDARKGKAMFDFGEAVAETLRDFPAMVGNTAFVDTRNGFVIAPGLDLQQLIANMPTSGHALVNGTATEGEHRSIAWRSETSGHQALIFARLRKGVAYIDDEERDAAYWYDHELGHLATQEGIQHVDWKKGQDDAPQHSRMEGAADAYAGIRNRQRFGDTNDLEMMAHMRTQYMFVGGDRIHTTTLVLERVLLDAKSADFISLTPQETADIADEYARAYALPIDSVREINTIHYKYLARLDPLNPDPKALEELADTLINKKGIREERMNDPYVFYCGAHFLKPYLDHGSFFTQQGGEAKLSGPFWDDIRQKIKDYETAIPDQHVYQRFIENRKDVTAATAAEKPVSAPTQQCWPSRSS